GKSLPFGVLVEIRNVPQLRALIRQRLDEMVMSVADGSHREAGAEIEIAFAICRNEPAALAALEGDLGPGVGRNHSGSRVGDAHRKLLWFSRKISFSRAAMRGAKKKPPP